MHVTELGREKPEPKHGCKCSLTWSLLLAKMLKFDLKIANRSIPPLQNVPQELLSLLDPILLNATASSGPPAVASATRHQNLMYKALNWTEDADCSQHSLKHA